MKIVATITDATCVVHIGGDISRESAIIDIPDDLVPGIIKEHFKRTEWARSGENRHCYETLSFSLLNERQ